MITASTFIKAKQPHLGGFRGSGARTVVTEAVTYIITAPGTLLAPRTFITEVHCGGTHSRQEFIERYTAASSLLAELEDKFVEYVSYKGSPWYSSFWESVAPRHIGRGHEALNKFEAALTALAQLEADGVMPSRWATGSFRMEGDFPKSMVYDLASELRCNLEIKSLQLILKYIDEGLERIVRRTRVVPPPAANAGGNPKLPPPVKPTTPPPPQPTTPQATRKPSPPANTPPLSTRSTPSTDSSPRTPTTPDLPPPLPPKDDKYLAPAPAESKRASYCSLPEETLPASTQPRVLSAKSNMKAVLGNLFPPKPSCQLPARRAEAHVPVSVPPGISTAKTPNPPRGPRKVPPPANPAASKPATSKPVNISRTAGDSHFASSAPSKTPVYKLPPPPQPPKLRVAVTPPTPSHLPNSTPSTLHMPDRDRRGENAPVSSQVQQVPPSVASSHAPQEKTERARPTSYIHSQPKPSTQAEAPPRPAANARTPPAANARTPPAANADARPAPSAREEKQYTQPAPGAGPYYVPPAREWYCPRFDPHADLSPSAAIWLSPPAEDENLPHYTSGHPVQSTDGEPLQHAYPLRNGVTYITVPPLPNGRAHAGMPSYTFRVAVELVAAENPDDPSHAWHRDQLASHYPPHSWAPQPNF
ncbi:unnamed protein product [Cutaneotrichosporon oleaginosum]